MASGFGRTGKLFASEHFGAEPDMLCLLSEQSGESFTIFPALTIERSVAEEGLDILESCVGRAGQAHPRAA